MEMWGIDLMEHKGGHMIVATDYFLGYILIDGLQVETAVCYIITQLQFQKIWSH